MNNECIHRTRIVSGSLRKQKEVLNILDNLFPMNNSTSSIAGSLLILQINYSANTDNSSYTLWACSYGSQLLKFHEVFWDRKRKKSQTETGFQGTRSVFPADGLSLIFILW